MLESRPMHLRFALVALVAVACITDAPIPLRGPLVRLTSALPASLQRCEPVQRSYAVPFWHAPYRECRDTVAGHLRFIEMDADSVLTELVENWIAPPAKRQRAFDDEVRKITALVGAGFRCAPNRVIWHARDSVRVSLVMQVNTDVGGPEVEDSVPSTIRRYARLGPLLDALWCHNPSAPAP